MTLSLNDENDTSFLWVTFIVINLLDFVSTAINVGVYGPMVEMNPIIRPLIEHFGMFSVLAWKVVWVSAAYIYLKELLKYHSMIFLNIALLTVVYGNVFLK